MSSKQFYKLNVFVLQKTSHKDVEANSNLQSEVRNYETKTQQLEQKISALKEADEQYKIEKETIIENLNKQVDSMKKRQVRTNNEQIMTLDDDNKKMVRIEWRKYFYLILNMLLQVILFEIDCAIFTQIYMNCFVSSYS